MVSNHPIFSIILVFYCLCTALFSQLWLALLPIIDRYPLHKP